MFVVKSLRDGSVTEIVINLNYICYCGTFKLTPKRNEQKR